MVADAQLFDAESVAAMAQRVILRAAITGNCVIVGRGAECVLRGHPGVLRVFIYSGWAERLARARQRLGANSDPGGFLRSADRTRAAYVRRYFGRDWKDPQLYHLMISSQVGIEEAASMILRAVKGSEFAAAADPTTRLSEGKAVSVPA